MNYLKKVHRKFLTDVIKSAQLDSNPYTTMPTVIFLACSFVLLYLQFHRYTYSSTTRWKTRIYKDVIFHWVYFYVVRIWFLFLRFGRYIMSTLDSYIEMTCRKEEIFVNQTINHSLIFMFTLTLSMLPLLVLSVQQIYSRNIPNFFIWVAEDPWVGSEIGTSGHYLERPARVAPGYKTKNSAYRSRRSTSADTDIFEKKKPLTFRLCKSLTSFNVATTINDVLEPNPQSAQ